MKKFLNAVKVAILVRILHVSDSLSARIRLNLGLYEPARRPSVVIEARSFRPGRVPYAGPRTFSRRNRLRPVEFESGDQDDDLG